MTLNPVLETVTERIKERSLDTRRQYLARMANAAQAGPARGHLSAVIWPTAWRLARVKTRIA